MRPLIRTVSRETALLPVHAWRLISSRLPPRCRYHPSCSQYCVDAVRQRGIVAGLFLAAWRVLRCNPWSYGGYDPVRAPKKTPICSDYYCRVRPARAEAQRVARPYRDRLGSRL